MLWPDAGINKQVVLAGVYITYFDADRWCVSEPLVQDTPSLE